MGLEVCLSSSQDPAAKAATHSAGVFLELKVLLASLCRLFGCFWFQMRWAGTQVGSTTLPSKEI